jgi:hypothetical protein
MSFGLRNAAQTFQRFMDDIIRDLDFCFAYMDDILVFSRSPEQHERHLRTIFQQLQANPAKCVFRVPEVTFLGYTVSGKGSRPAHLQACPPPKNVRQLLQFRCFMPHAAATQAPLHDTFSGPRAKGSHPITWTPELLRSFDECKTSLGVSPQLTSQSCLD